MIRALSFACALALAAGAHAQPAPASQGQTPQTQTQPADPIGRETPRGAVLGFLTAARNGEQDLAALYLNTRQEQPGTAELTQQLFTVLDARLPASDLTHLSASPEGSRANPLAPDEERIATIRGPTGPVDIGLERVSRPKLGSIWLFSRKTLEAVPDLYEDVAATRTPRFLPRFLTDTRVAGVRLFDWLAMILGIAGLYVAIKALNRVLTRVVAWISGRFFGRPWGAHHVVLPTPARLLILAIAARVLLRQLELSLRIRQLLSNVAGPLAIGVLVWLGLVLAADVERYVRRRISTTNAGALISLARLGRRLLDAIVIMFGIILILRHFGVDPTPIVAGLGVGGIAVALAAQKTLENVIAGASLIMDQAVSVGDSLRAGTVEGTVEYIGLRSTRIRTLDRTIVSVPNGQIANMTLETLSARDKFWLHPVVGLRYETTPDQVRLVIEGVRQMLGRQAEVEGPSIRVRLLRLNTFSLDVEVFAYLYARDWAHFLEMQETLLLKITEIVAAAGTGLAFPSQTMYLNRDQAAPATSEQR